MQALGPTLQGQWLGGVGLEEVRRLRLKPPCKRLRKLVRRGKEASSATGWK